MQDARPIISTMKIQLQNVLRRELRSRQLSINSVAKACNIPGSVLHGWLNGALPSAKNLLHLKKLSEFFNLPISVLLFNTIDEPKATNIVMVSEFLDGDVRYRLFIEKVT